MLSLQFPSVDPWENFRELLAVSGCNGVFIAGDRLKNLQLVHSVHLRRRLMLINNVS